MKRYTKIFSIITILMILITISCFAMSCSLSTREIEFDVNGKITKENYKAGMTVKVPARVGYQFAGWQGEDGEIYENIDDAVNAGNIKLTAKYSAIEYTLTLYTNGGRILNEAYTPHYDSDGQLEYYTRTFNIESEFDLPKYNYGVKDDLDYSAVKGVVNFYGWYESLDDTGYGKEKTKIKEGTRNDLTLYAYTTSIVKATTITIYGLDQETVVDVVKIDEGNVVQLSSDNYSLEGYTFGGFYIDKNFRNELYVGYKAPSKNEQINVYIKWNPKTYNIKYYDMSGDLKHTEQVNTAQIIDHTNGYNAINLDERYYNFDAWQIKIDDTFIDFEDDVMPPRSIELYPRYSLRQYLIVWEINGESYQTYAHYSDMPQIPSEIDTYKPETEGYTYNFIGWTSSVTESLGIEVVTQNVTYTATYDEKIKDFECVFVNEGKLLQIYLKVIYGTPIIVPSETPTKDSTEEYVYTFNCWKYDSNGDGELDATYKAGDRIRKNMTFYACYNQSIRQYVVTWDLNNGTGHKYDDLVSYNSRVSYSTNKEVPTKASNNGYDFNFVGWSIDGINVESSFVIKSDITIFALYQYNADSYSYVYYNENQVFAMGVGLLVEGSEEYVPYISGIPTKASTAQYDFVFDGWYYDSDGDGEVDTKFNSSDNLCGVNNGDLIVLKAVYQENIRHYTVTYRWPNSSVVAYEDFAYGNYCVFEGLTPFEKAGYKIIGWSLYPSLALPMGLDQSIEIIEDTTLYAITEPIEYHITYVLNGGTSGIGLKTIYDVETPTFNLGRNVTKQYYIFDGWYLEESFDTELVYIEIGSTTSYTVYAKWIPIEYSLTYVLGENGQNNVLNPISYNVETGEIILNNPTRKGYEFDGWYLDADCENSPITSIAANSHGEMTIYAKWNPIVYMITLKANFEGNTQEDLIYNIAYDSPFYFTSNMFERSGYTIVGWNYVDEGTPLTLENGKWIVDGERVFTAIWDYANYSITYVMNNGANDSRNKDSFKITDTITLYPASRNGYEFAGWYLNEDFSGGSIEQISPNTYTNDIVLYAKFSTIVYNITYTLNGGTNNSRNPLNYTSDDAYVIYAPTKEHYNFLGWRLNDNEDNPLMKNFTINIGTIGNIKLEAIWEAKTYEINYTFMNTSNNSYLYSITNNNQTSYVYGSSSIALSDVSCQGYDFIGWYEDSLAETERIYNIDTTKGYDIYLFGLFVSKTMIVSFNSNGGSVVESIQVGYGLRYTNLPNPTKTGYVFDGWYYQNTKITSTTKVNQLQNHTLEAHWTLEEYNITYTLNGGTNPQNQLLTYNIETNDTLKIPTKPGYEFIGWKNHGLEYNITLGSMGDIAVEAEWEIKNYTITYQFKAGAYSFGSRPNSYNINSNDITLSSMGCNGYTFAGWKLEGELDSQAQINRVIPHGSYGDLVFIAVFNAISYEIKFFSDYENSFTETYNLDGDLELPTPNVIPEGLEFIGWTNDLIFSSNIYEDFSYDVSNYNLYALFASEGLQYSLVDQGNESYLKVVGYTSNAKTILIPSSYKYNSNFYYVKEIGQGAFENSTIEVVKAHGVGIVKSRAFAGSQLKEIYLESVESIEENAFLNCLNLETISLQGNIDIEENAFMNVSTIIIVFYCDTTDTELIAQIESGDYDFEITIAPTGNSSIINATREIVDITELLPLYNSFYN